MVPCCRGAKLEQPPLDLPDIWIPWRDQGGSLMCTPWGYATPECLVDGRGLLPWEWHHFQEVHERLRQPQQQQQEQLHQQQDKEQQQQQSQQHHQQEQSQKQQDKVYWQQQQQGQQHSHVQHQLQDQQQNASNDTALHAVVLHAVHFEEPQHTDLYSQDSQGGMLHHMVEVDPNTGLEQAKGLEEAPILLVDSLVHMTLSKGHGEEQQQYAEMQQGCLVLNNTAFTARFEPHEYSRNSSSDPMAATHTDAHLHRHIRKKGRLHLRSQTAI